MTFAHHMGTVFRMLGRPALYTPPAGAAVPCRAIRATKPLRFGSIDLPVEVACFDLLRGEVTPALGGTITVDGTTYPVDVPPVPFPVDQDPEGLRWRLLCGWGSPVVIRSVTGSGATLRPPMGSDHQLAADAAAGATSITIKAMLATGQLGPGDTLTLGGQVHAITNTVSASSGAWPGVQVDPPLSADVATGAPVSLTWGRDFRVRAAVAGYAAEQIHGGVLVGDRRLIIPAAALIAAGMADEPQANNAVTVGGRTINVHVATAAFQAGAPVLWELVVRG